MSTTSGPETNSDELRTSPIMDESRLEILRLFQKMERLGWIEINMKNKRPGLEHKRPMCELLIVDSDEDPVLITMNQLVLLLESQLADLGGRMTLSSTPSTSTTTMPSFPPTNSLLTRMMGNASYYPFVVRAMEKLLENHDRTTNNAFNHQQIFPRIQIIGQPNHHCDLIACEYMDKVMLQTFELFDHEKMERIMITDLARKTFQLPTDLLYTSIQRFLKASSSTSPSGKTGFVINDGGKDGAKQLLSPLYISRKKDEIFKSLQVLKEPKVLDLRWFQSYEWDVGCVANYIRSICILKSNPSISSSHVYANSIDADVHMTFDPNYLIGEAVFIPTSYTRMQHEKIIAYYSLHGYISYHHCLVLGISKSRIKDCLIELLVREFLCLINLLIRSDARPYVPCLFSIYIYIFIAGCYPPLYVLRRQTIFSSAIRSQPCPLYP